MDKSRNFSQILLKPWCGLMSLFFRRVYTKVQWKKTYIFTFILQKPAMEMGDPGLNCGHVFFLA